MAEQNPTRQDQRRGGYGDSTGGQSPVEGDSAPASGATGRESPVTDSVDADEALGNRTGGYGGNPPAEEGTDAE